MPPDGPVAPERSRDRRAAEQKLIAWLSLHDSRVRELAWLRAVAIASLPAWTAACWPSTPGFLRRIGFLAQAFCLTMVAAHATTERRWSHRLAMLDPVRVGVAVHAIATPWDEVRTALWYGLAVASAVPWGYAGLGRSIPGPLAPTLFAVGWVVVLLVALAETLAARARSQPPDR
jgi:hypothetical protein